MKTINKSQNYISCLLKFVIIISVQQQCTFVYLKWFLSLCVYTELKWLNISFWLLWVPHFMFSFPFIFKLNCPHSTTKSVGYSRLK